MLCPDRRFLQDPGNGPETEETPQDFVDSIGSEDTEAFKIKEKPNRWDALEDGQDGTKGNNNVAAQHLYTDRYCGIFDEYTHTETNFEQQRQNNERQTRIGQQMNSNAVRQH